MIPHFKEKRSAPEGNLPAFPVAALKNPLGANLDRYQIVRSWLDERGMTHEYVYDLVWSGDRQPGLCRNILHPFDGVRTGRLIEAKERWMP
jgi:hypothetical protein